MNLCRSGRINLLFIFTKCSGKGDLSDVVVADLTVNIHGNIG